MLSNKKKHLFVSMSVLLKVPPLVSLGADIAVNSEGQLPCCLFLLLCTSVDDKRATVTRNNAWIYVHQSVYKYRGLLLSLQGIVLTVGLFFKGSLCIDAFLEVLVTKKAIEHFCHQVK